MRKKERERDAVFATGVFNSCSYATIATVNLDGTPYCIPVSPILIGNDIYFHCAAEGKKLDNILKNPNVCISCVGKVEIPEEMFTVKYESAVAFGKCEIIKDTEERINALREICKKYTPNNLNGFDTALNKWIEATCVCKVTVKEITGKENI